MVEKERKKVVNVIQDERIYSRRKAYSGETCFYIELVQHHPSPPRASIF